MNCAKCHSENVKKEKYQDVDVIICNQCGFDERDELESEAGEKSSQREKSRYSPFKAGR